MFDLYKSATVKNISTSATGRRPHGNASYESCGTKDVPIASSV